MSIKKLSFKGDSSPTKKRKRPSSANNPPSASSTTTDSRKSEDSLTTATKSARASVAEDGWVDAECLDDIHGPIMLAFCYDLPVSLASDARGSVFTLPLADNSTSVTLAEAAPHDVRQVFLATGTPAHHDQRGEGTVSLKSGATNKYLGTDRVGDVKCDTDAVGPAEQWRMIKRPDGWAVQSTYDTFLSIDDGSGGKEGAGVRGGRVRSDASEIGFCETFRVRIQAQNRAKRQKSSSNGDGGGGKGLALLSKKELETKCGRVLTFDEVDALREAQRRGDLGEAVLDMRVKGRSDKFG